MTTAPLPPLRNLEDLEAIERVPLEDRGLPASTWALLTQASEEVPDSPASVWLPDPSDPVRAVTLSYAELHDRVERTARALAAIGVSRADAVSFTSPNTSSLLVAILAAEAAGIAAPINPLFDAPRVAELLRASGSAVLITAGPEFDAERWERTRDADIGVRAILALRPDGVSTAAPALGRRDGVEVHYLDDLVRSGAAAAFVPPTADDLAAFFHTGGTTGSPKVAAHTHRNEVVMAWSIAVGTGMGPQSRALAGLPLFHVNALLVTALAPIVARAASVWPGPLGWRDPRLMSGAWRLIEHFGITTMSAVPTVYARLAAEPIDADVSTLRVPIVGAAPLARPIADAFENAVGVPLLEGYGLTEATCASTFTPFGRAVAGQVGQRLPYQRVSAARVGEDAVELVADGEVGEIVIAGPTVFAGYVSRGADGARVLQTPVTGAGWLRTGDLGVVTPEQTLRLHGRSKDLIIRGGHNIDPGIIEDAFVRHPLVADAVAVGMPDPLAGELPVVYCSLATDAEPTHDELVAWSIAQIDEPAARPVRIHLVAAIPLTAVGKVFKPELRRLSALDAARSILNAHDIETDVDAVLTDSGIALVLPPGADGRADALLQTLALPLRRLG